MTEAKPDTLETILAEIEAYDAEPADTRSMPFIPKAHGWLTRALRVLIAEGSSIDSYVHELQRTIDLKAERDEARRLHAEAESQIACRNEMRARIAELEKERDSLRSSLLNVIRVTSGAVSDDVSNEFLGHVAEEVQRTVFALKADSDEAHQVLNAIAKRVGRDDVGPGEPQERGVLYAAENAIKRAREERDAFENRAESLEDRIRTIADEECGGPHPPQSAEDALTLIERTLFEHRADLSRAIGSLDKLRERAEAAERHLASIGDQYSRGRRDERDAWLKSKTIAEHVREEVTRAVEEEREACAKVPEAMIVGGRAWTEEQELAAKMLHDVADNIRARGAKAGA